MLSPFNNDEAEIYFNRLHAQLKRMPPEHRAEVRQELRQHLEALAAAYRESGSSPEEAVSIAMQQFGDPAHVGRQLMKEWKMTQNQGRKELWKLIVSVGLGQAIVWSLIYVLILSIQAHFIPHTGIGSHTPATTLIIFTFLGQIMYYLGSIIPLFSGLIIGCKIPEKAMPEQAVPIAFYASLIYAPFATIIPMAYAGFVMHQHFLPVMYYLLRVPLAWICTECVTAYAACLYKRSGSRRLRLADWKLRVG